LIFLRVSAGKLAATAALPSQLPNAARAADHCAGLRLLDEMPLERGILLVGQVCVDQAAEEPALDEDEHERSIRQRRTLKVARQRRSPRLRR
jgi:hypothetical protein